MIRRARASDRVRVIELLQNSRAGAGFDTAYGFTGFTFPFDPAFAAQLFTSHLLLPNMLCLVLDEDDAAQGVLMAAAYVHPFGPVRIARETVWWIEPEYRGHGAVRMLDAYEDWVREQDCDFSGLAGMGDDPPVGRLYRRRGYRVAETHFLRAL
jgi:GNAT superfamily N-acetyltransferase